MRLRLHNVNPVPAQGGIADVGDYGREIGKALRALIVFSVSVALNPVSRIQSCP
jgi:hypothetical protein